jgi:hypothetical protein
MCPTATTLLDVARSLGVELEAISAEAANVS